MVKSQKQSKRKPSGGRLSKNRDKRKFELGRPPALTKIGQRKQKTKRVLGGNLKKSLLAFETVNLYDFKAKSYKKAKVLKVLKNPANRHFVRRNIITKGSIIETDAGNAKVTSRPGQEDSVNAILI